MFTTTDMIGVLFLGMAFGFGLTTKFLAEPIISAPIEKSIETKEIVEWRMKYLKVTEFTEIQYKEQELNKLKKEKK